MVGYTLEVVASEDKRDEIMSILRSLGGPVSVIDGCLSCRISQDLDDPAILRLREEWKSEELLRSRIRSGDFRKVLAVMDLSSEPPRVQFDLPSGKKGIEYLSVVKGDSAIEEKLR